MGWMQGERKKRRVPPPHTRYRMELWQQRRRMKLEGRRWSGMEGEAGMEVRGISEDSDPAVALDPEAHRLREGSWHKLRTVVFTHLEGPLILSTNFPSRPSGAGLVCFPPVIRFMMGKAGFPLTQQTPLPSARP